MRRVELPADGAALHIYFAFATTTFDGYGRYGGVERLGEFANEAVDAWRRDETLPSSVDDLRAVLFFEARRWHHFGGEPDDEADRYVRALVARLRVLSNGEVKRDRL